MAPLPGALEGAPYHCGPGARRFELLGSRGQISQPAPKSLQGHIAARARGLTKNSGSARRLQQPEHLTRLGARKGAPDKPVRDDQVKRFFSIGKILKQPSMKRDP